MSDRQPPPGATRIVLVRHGQAACNVQGIVGGIRGCTGLTELGRQQAGLLRDRVAERAEMAGAGALYTSVLPRAVETAEVLLPALERWRDGAPISVQQRCDLCELHPGAADGMTWEQFEAAYGLPDWDVDPDQAVAPQGESWRGFVDRASSAVRELARAHPAQRVVAVCHAGVIEATLLRFLPSGGPVRWGLGRIELRTSHTSITEWEHHDGRWLLLRYNDAAHLSPVCTSLSL